MVITSKNPVKAVLSLVFTFVATAAVWLMAKAEFLALVLIVVYVGAVMVLFLFVVMMLDIKQASSKASFVKYWPIALIFGTLISAILLYVFMDIPILWDTPHSASAIPKDFSNISSIGMKLFSEFVYPFEVAGVILLTAMIAAICLVNKKVRAGTRAQIPAKQISTDPKDRLTLLKTIPHDKSKGRKK